MNTIPEVICEVRVPTYKRPELLERALRSLVSQSYRDWRCIVFDDCPEGTARAVVENIGDGRITYSHNPKPLGAIGNIDQAFRREAMLNGRYAFILEDDNYLFENHIAHAVRLSEAHGAKVLFLNQRCEHIDKPGEPGHLGDETTLDWIYKEGLFSPHELMPALLFSHGFSNGAVFWRTDAVSNFEMGTATKRPGMQETMRLLRVREPVYVSLLPSSVWRWNDARDSFVNRWQLKRSLWRSLKRRLDSLSERKEKLNCIRAMVREVTLPGLFDYVGANAERPVQEMEKSLLLSGFNVKLTARPFKERVALAATGRLIRWAPFL